MIVLASRHKKEVAELTGTIFNLMAQRDSLLKQWNTLIARINAKGGEAFLNNAVIPGQSVQLNEDDIKRLLMLCHPDKHNGKPMAEEMTQKLLALRKWI